MPVALAALNREHLWPPRAAPFGPPGSPAGAQATVTGRLRLGAGPRLGGAAQAASDGGPARPGGGGPAWPGSWIFANLC